MTMTKKPKERPLVRRRIETLLSETEVNGCTAGEAAAVLEKAKELVAKYELNPDAFRWLPRPELPLDLTFLIVILVNRTLAVWYLAAIAGGVVFVLRERRHPAIKTHPMSRR
jgi:hypothetical protein